MMIIHIAVSAVFIVMAAIQLNDPDPLLWVCIYLAIAAVPVSRVFGYRLPWLFWITAGMAIACLMISFPGFIQFLNVGDFGSIAVEMSLDRPYIEPAREFLGVMIGITCLCCYREWHLTN